MPRLEDFVNRGAAAQRAVDALGAGRPAASAYTSEQRAIAAFAAGALRVAALSLKRVGLETEAAPLFVQHDRLVEIGGVTFARDAELQGGGRPESRR